MATIPRVKAGSRPFAGIPGLFRPWEEECPGNHQMELCFGRDRRGSRGGRL